VKQFVDLALLERKNFSQTICIAHNSQSFDCQFVLKYMVEKLLLEPKLILNGTKIILMTIEKVKFVDSLNYLHMPLSALPKAFGLPELEKGTFPHLFNTRENSNYVGELPDIENYSINSMSCAEREKFLTWYNEKKQANYVFGFKKEILKYCKDDVNILRQACLAFRKSFLETGDTCPFSEATTIASTCMRVYRKNFLKPNTIGIVPPRGYRFANNQSVVAVKWLVWMEKQLNRKIAHAGRYKEISLPIGVTVDGFCDPTLEETHRGIVLQLHGCFYHGCL